MLMAARSPLGSFLGLLHETHVTFAVGRIDDQEEIVEGAVHSSAELVEHDVHAGDAVLALDGATLDESRAAAIAEAAAIPGAMPPSSVSRP